MTKRWMMGAAAAALTVAGAVAAQAADLPTKKGPPPAPVYVPPPFTWTGFYVGANIGGAWNTGNTKLNAYFPASGIYYANYFGNSLGSGASGVIGGAQAGYNYQSGAAVFGLETDFDWTGLSKTKTLLGTPFTTPFAATDAFTTSGKAQLDWLGTTRLRVGFVATPDNRLMVYGTGGLAYGGVKGTYSIYDYSNVLSWGGSKTTDRFGWTIGAGAEYAVTNNITIKGEYLYYSLGSANTTISPLSYSVFMPASSWISAKTTYEGSIFRAGVNYKF